MASAAAAAQPELEPAAKRARLSGGRFVGGSGPKKVAIVATGGTIDKAYPRLHGGWAFEIDEPAAGSILERIRPSHLECSITSVCKKDSQEITDEDRAAILEACATASADWIIVTHGTDTMCETARYLGAVAEERLRGKSVVLTGSMRPERMVDTDAHFNLGVCVGALGVCAAGVYVAMNGGLHSWRDARRDLESGLFVGSGGAATRRRLTIAATGGTIDKAYPRLHGGWAFEIDEPAAGKILDRVTPSVLDYSITSVCKKDSQEITDEDREKLLLECERAESDWIIVTHGTDTLCQTARYLGQSHRERLAGKAIVLTGAMRPERLVDTDAHFNIGACIGLLNGCEPGVYLCMNGMAHNWQAAERDLNTGLFITARNAD
eukprot:TRINITY_DN46375_c0_g1_i1.p1 TRINITY_DN46375_c0_g1~~TRINITY_DN46375_c0_g1_i1.p1  ORF type:complete len:421 (+),score=60.39 TRINITY_DN46375_c0_g1_i1:129-1265(+)